MLSIQDNYNLSIVMPFYKKCDVFKITLQKNAYYLQRNGIEVIIAMDEASESNSVLELISQYPFINWRVVVNPNEHAWRNPACAINVGIQHASKKYVLVVGPDSEMATDVIDILLKKAHHYKGCFYVGTVQFVDYDFQYDGLIQEPNKYLGYYGSILAERSHLLQVRGYDESLDGWGGDDDNIRARLQQIGLYKFRVPEAVLLHREEKHQLESSRVIKHSSVSMLQNKKAYFPVSSKANVSGNWGKDFDLVVYDYLNRSDSAKLCEQFLSGADFVEFEVFPQNFLSKYRTIALLNTHNESTYINSALKHLENHCDGVVLIDDASIDNSYELAVSKNLLVKAKQKKREFCERDNKNTLLNLASFFSADFLFFCDADEIFDERFMTPNKLNLDGFDSIAFYLVHLWNSADTFRVDIPEPSPINVPGVIHRWRMFKNIGRMQFITERKMHFPAIPYTGRRGLLPVLIKHYGMLDQETRSSKYSTYQTTDTEIHLDKDKYEYFLDDSVELTRLGELKLEQRNLVVNDNTRKDAFGFS